MKTTTDKLMSDLNCGYENQFYFLNTTNNIKNHEYLTFIH